jgi:hypothetical protein
MERITNLPQTVLKQILSAYNAHPERLSDGERNFAAKIRVCCFCTYHWPKRRKKEPDQCPSCHKRGWDRPFINALAQAHPTTEEAPNARTEH